MSRTVRTTEPADSEAVAVTSGRSLAARRLGRTVLVAAGLTGSLLAFAPLASAAPATSGTPSATSGFLAHLNALRGAHGLRPLSESGDLMSLAEGHSFQMAASGSIFHNPNLANAVANWEVVGENVGMGPSVAALDSAFDASPEHYANEVNTSYTQVGIGAVTASNGEIYVTLDFRMPMNSAPAPAPAPVHHAPPAPARPAAPVSHSTVTVRHTSTAHTTVTAPRPTAHVTARVAPHAAPHVAAHVVATRVARPTSDSRVTAFVAPAGTDPLARALAFASTVSHL